MSGFWALAFSRRIVLNALKVALVVGLILNAINQGGALLAMHGVHWGHVALNFITPYCVATFSAVKNELDRRKGS